VPNYDFDVAHEGASTSDLGGTWLPDMAAAFQEARRALGDLYQDAMMTAALPGSIRVETGSRDQHGSALVRLRGQFDLTLAPGADLRGSTSTQGDT